MADPVLFLSPRVESEQELAHRIRLAKLPANDLLAYRKHVAPIYDQGKLREEWRWHQIEEEFRRRNG